MLFDMPRRALGTELMDDFDVNDHRLDRTLRELPRLNRWLGGYGPVRAGLRDLLRARGRTVTVLDVGSASADLPVRIVDWAHRAGGTVRITASDANPVTVAFARRTIEAAGIESDAIDCVVADVFELPFEDDTFDVVVASQLLHHFSESQITRVLAEMARVARHRVVVADLQRNWIALIGIRLLTVVFGFGSMIRVDAPLSVRKGFVRGELRAAAAAAGLPARERWHPLFRWSLVGEPAIRRTEL